MDTYKADDNSNDDKKNKDYDDILVDIDPNDMIPYGMQNINELMQMIREIIQEMALKPGEADNNALGFFESTRYWTHGTEAYAPDIDTDPRTKYLRFAQCEELHSLTTPEVSQLSVADIRTKYLYDTLPCIRGKLRRGQPSFDGYPSDDVSDDFLDTLICSIWREQLMKYAAADWDTERADGCHELKSRDMEGIWRLAENTMYVMAVSPGYADKEAEDRETALANMSKDYPRHTDEDYETMKTDPRTKYLQFIDNEEIHKITTPEASYISTAEIRTKYLGPALPFLRKKMRKEGADYCDDYVSEEVSDETLDQILCLVWREALLTLSAAGWSYNAVFGDMSEGTLSAEEIDQLLNGNKQ